MFLPFEDDPMLSASSSSKAFLLVNDASITDRSIARQIGGMTSDPGSGVSDGPRRPFVSGIAQIVNGTIRSKPLEVLPTRK